MQFVVPGRDRLPPETLERIYVAGMDHIPWRCRSTWQDDLLSVARDTEESGNVYIPWPLPGGGEVVLATASLMEREEPYHLPVELARGTLGGLREQIALWDQMGLALSDEVSRSMARAIDLFSRAATQQNEPSEAARTAEEAVAATLQTISLIGGSYARQVIEARCREEKRLPTLLGVNLGPAAVDPAASPRLEAAFNTAVVPLSWRSVEASEGVRTWEVADAQVEWCRAVGLKVLAGPLVGLGERGVPGWTYLWENDVDNALSVMLQYVEAAVERYQGQVHLWNVAGGVGPGKALSLSEEEQLRVVAQLVDTVRRLDPGTPLVVSFDQPWAEYLGQSAHNLPPLHFADALARADLGLAGVGLEINAGFWPGGTPARTLIDYSSQIDLWSQLGLPLMLSLTAPGDAGPDAQANRITNPCSPGPGLEASPGGQAAWVDTYLPMFLAKNCVQVVVWNQWDDRLPHEFPHGGLVDRRGRPRTSLASLARFKQAYLE